MERAVQSNYGANNVIYCEYPGAAVHTRPMASSGFRGVCEGPANCEGTAYNNHGALINNQNI